MDVLELPYSMVKKCAQAMITHYWPGQQLELMPEDEQKHRLALAEVGLVAAHVPDLLAENVELKRQIAVMRQALERARRDFELINTSGLWQGHEFTHAIRDIDKALSSTDTYALWQKMKDVCEEVRYVFTILDNLPPEDKPVLLKDMPKLRKALAVYEEAVAR